MIIKVISENRGSALIEWTDEYQVLQRGRIPTELISNQYDNAGQVDDNLMSLVVRYGIQWEAIIQDEIRTLTPEALANELRKRGLWTLADLRAHPQEVMAALQALYGLDFQILLRAAEAREIKPGGN